MHSVKLALLGLFCLPVCAVPVITSTFTSGSEGWTVVNDGASTAVVYVSTGGNPGGYIQRTDQTAAYMHFSAPAAFLGDLSGYQGGTLSYQIRQTTASSDTEWFYREVLQGAGLLLLNTNSLAPNTTGWVERNILLSAGNWIVIADLESYSGPTATAGQLQAVLANLTGLYITGDLISGTGDVASLDNVTLTPTPEPGTAALVALALAVLGRRKTAR